ncbi:ABC transporter substrate-binding protein [Streptomyces sp. NPDC054784]
MLRQNSTPLRAVVALAVAGGLLTACGDEGDEGSENSLSVLMVDNPQMMDLQKLTAEHFTKDTGVEVDFTVMPENEVREEIRKDFSNQSGKYDVATVSNYEVPIYAKNRWLHALDPFVYQDKGFAPEDILTPMQVSLSGEDGKTYGTPFYGESSILMYRKDIFAKAGLKMPANPTWDEVADLAAEVEGAEKGMAGICLRGLPGWGEVIAPLTTVVNTMGGTWFDEDWQARLDSAEFEKATKFYVDLVREHGEPDAARSGYAECLNNMTQGKAAMWYDATAGAGSLEADRSPVKDRIGYVPAPVDKTKSSGWLYTWAWAMQKVSGNAENAWKFISWASGKEYEELVGKEVGWANVPAGKRASTYEIPEYQQDAKEFYEVTHDAIDKADPRNPGVQQRPAPGIQFVGIPEFTDLGTKVSQEISAAIAGKQSVDDALAKSQKLAEKVGRKYRR